MTPEQVEVAVQVLEERLVAVAAKYRSYLNMGLKAQAKHQRETAQAIEAAISHLLSNNSVFGVNKINLTRPGSTPQPVGRTYRTQDDARSAARQLQMDDPSELHIYEVCRRSVHDSGRKTS